MQATANTITGLNKTLAAMITHCFQIGTVPMGDVQVALTWAILRSGRLTSR